MNFFGPPWDTPLAEKGEFRPTPVGDFCFRCHEMLVEGDRGMFEVVISALSPAMERPVHRECSLRAVVGGIAHVEGRCTCCGGTADPDDGLNYRESARRVWLATWGKAP